MRVDAIRALQNPQRRVILIAVFDLQRAPLVVKVENVLGRALETLITGPRIPLTIFEVIVPIPALRINHDRVAPISDVAAKHTTVLLGLRVHVAAGNVRRVLDALGVVVLEVVALVAKVALLVLLGLELEAIGDAVLWVARG